MSVPHDHLTGESIAPSSARHVAVAVLVAVAVACLVNVGAALHLQRSPSNRGYWLVERKWQKLESLEGPVDWLFLGDSSCNQGVRPDVWREATGDVGVNLCTIGDMLAVNDAWMLERYVDKHGAPRGGVVVVHVYDAWHRGVSSAFRGPLLARVPLPWGFWSRQSPSVAMSRADEGRLFTAKFLPLYADNVTLAKSAFRAIGLDRTASPQLELDASGYMPHHEANPSGVASDTRQHATFVRKASFRASAANLAALARIRELAETHRFHVYLATSPVHDELPRNPAWMRYVADVRRMLEQAVAGSTYVHNVMQSPLGFPASRMENADHLVHDAAADYTRALAASVMAPEAPGNEASPASAAP